MDRNQRDTLATCLTQVFGSIDEAFVDRVVPHLDWVELDGGATLFREGDAQDGVYFVLSGRLRVSVQSDRGPRVVNEVGRGETVGEMAVVTGERRSATVTAIRDTVLARASGETFRTLCREQPELPLNVARITIERLRRSAGRPRAARPSTICLLAVTPGVDVAGFAEQLRGMLDRWGVTTIESSAHVDGHFGAGTSQVTAADADARRRLELWLDDLEFWNEFVLLVADDGDTAWTRRCLRHADEVLLLAAGDAPPQVLDLERSLFDPAGPITNAHQTLVLLHGQGTQHPRGTAAWIDRRRVDSVVHIRPNLDRDIARLARVVSGNAIALVLGGGGARGFAHLGIYKALEEAGVQVDLVAGTSMGAAMGGLFAVDLRADEAIRIIRKAFRKNPTNDFNVIPMVSLIRGRKLRRTIDAVTDEAAGAGADVCDSWRTFRLIATNFTRAAEKVLDRGPVAKAVRASASIPIALPPVPWDGDLLVDGSVFNNFPTSLAMAMGARRIIAIDLSTRKAHPYNHDEVPGSLELLRDRIFGGKRRKYRLPGLSTLMMTMNLLYSESLRDEARRSVDLYINPALGGVPLLDWKGFDHIVELGYRSAAEVLASMSEEDLAPYRNP